MSQKSEQLSNTTLLVWFWHSFSSTEWKTFLEYIVQEHIVQMGK